jgi:vesicle-associated membrane protein 7
MNEDFGRTLQAQMEHFNGPSGDALSQVNNKLEDVKNVMVQNIEMVLERGEKLELLVDKTDQLQTQAFQFNKSSRKLRSAMWWKKMKCYAMIFLAVAMVIWIISMIACGGPS